MIPAAWFCPACQKHHAPHVETCPGVADAIGKPLPGIVTIPWPPQPSEMPWDRTPRPFYEQPIIGCPYPITTCGAVVISNPDLICVN